MTQLRKLWSFSGRVGRRQYLLVVVVAFLVKSNIDRMIATYSFHRSWGVLNYWFPFPAAGPTSLGGSSVQLAWTLLAVSVPFIWLGLAQTLKRLRDMGWPLRLTPLFSFPSRICCFSLCFVAGRPR
jgi:uncharacterized membrane protein YhaH (DUF805 family)